MPNLPLIAAAELELRKRRKAISATYGLSKPVIVKDYEHSLTFDKHTLKYKTISAKGHKLYLSTREFQETFFGGAKGGSKTTSGIKCFASDISQYENGVFVAMRRNWQDLKRTTIPSFEKFFPPELVVRKTSDVWHCVNGNQIWFYYADVRLDNDYERMRGLEATAILAEEATQFPQLFFENVPTLINRTIATHTDTGEPLKGYIIYTANPKPGQHYLKRMYVNDKTKVIGDGVHNFIQALPDDNPYVSPEQIDSWFTSASIELVRMLRKGEWDVEESSFVIVPTNTIDKLKTRIVDRRAVCGGIDVGLGAPDTTQAFGVNSKGQFYCDTVITNPDTMKQVEMLSPFVQGIKNNKGQVYIDASGVGKGLYDRLAEKFGTLTVVGVNFGSSPEEEKHKKTNVAYQNRRAQLYFWLRHACEEAINSDKPELGFDENEEDLFEELENTYYDNDIDKVRIEPKDNIKDRLGRSPDKADAVVLANAAWRKYVKVRDVKIPTVKIAINNNNQFSTFAGY